MTSYWAVLKQNLPKMTKPTMNSMMKTTITKISMPLEADLEFGTTVGGSSATPPELVGLNTHVRFASE